MIRRSGRRRTRGRDQSPAAGVNPDPWGEDGPPADYDPEAATGPIEVKRPAVVVHASLEVHDGVARTVPVAGTGDSAASPLHGGVHGARRGGRWRGNSVRLTRVEPAQPEPAGPEPAQPEAAQPEPAQPERAQPKLAAAANRRAGNGRPGGGDSPESADETRESTINDISGRMEYPLEVVPSAELVAIVSSGEGTELPHWADPPTGEVPRAITGPNREDDELQAWRMLGSRGLHWRDDANDWSDSPGVEDLVDEDDQSNAIRDEEGARDPFSFDEDFERLEHQRSGRGANSPYDGPGQDGEEGVVAAGDQGVPGQGGAEPGDETGLLSGGAGGPPPDDQTPARSMMRTGRRARRPGRPSVDNPLLPPSAARFNRGPYDARAEAPVAGNRDVGAAVVTGVVLVALLVVCYLIGPVALLVFSALAIAGCAIEAFSMLQRAGFRPATLLGVVGSAGIVAAAYWRGTAAIPVVVAVVVGGSLVWYLARVVDARPVVNVAVSVLAFCWIGVLGSFTGLLLAAHHGSNLFLGAVVPTIVADVVAWFVGSQLGTHQLAPAVSPGKTWEGVIAGGIAALVVGAVIGNQVTPWGGARHGLELGLMVAVVAPIGDLVQSMIKRDLRTKDSGTVLPGHGGLLDRFDSLLFVLPATYFLALALDIIIT